MSQSIESTPFTPEQEPELSSIQPQLDLYASMLNDQSPYTFADVLEANNALQYLELNDNDELVGPDGKPVVAEVVTWLNQMTSDDSSIFEDIRVDAYKGLQTVDDISNTADWIQEEYADFRNFHPELASVSDKEALQQFKALKASKVELTEAAVKHKTAEDAVYAATATDESAPAKSAEATKESLIPDEEVQRIKDITSAIIKGKTNPSISALKKVHGVSDEKAKVILQELARKRVVSGLSKPGEGPRKRTVLKNEEDLDATLEAVEDVSRTYATQLKAIDDKESGRYRGDAGNTRGSGAVKAALATEEQGVPAQADTAAAPAAEVKATSTMTPTEYLKAQRAKKAADKSALASYDATLMNDIGIVAAPVASKPEEAAGADDQVVLVEDPSLAGEFAQALLGKDNSPTDGTTVEAEAAAEDLLEPDFGDDDWNITAIEAPAPVTITDTVIETPARKFGEPDTSRWGTDQAVNVQAKPEFQPQMYAEGIPLYFDLGAKDRRGRAFNVIYAEAKKRKQDEQRQQEDQIYGQYMNDQHNYDQAQQQAAAAKEAEYKPYFDEHAGVVDSATAQYEQAKAMIESDYERMKREILSGTTSGEVGKTDLIGQITGKSLVETALEAAKEQQSAVSEPQVASPDLTPVEAPTDEKHIVLTTVPGAEHSIYGSEVSGSSATDISQIESGYSVAVPLPAESPAVTETPKSTEEQAAERFDAIAKSFEEGRDAILSEAGVEVTPWNRDNRGTYEIGEEGRKLIDQLDKEDAAAESAPAATEPTVVAKKSRTADLASRAAKRARGFISKIPRRKP